MTYVGRAKVSVLEEGPIFEPVPMTYEAGMSGTNDCQWVQMEGMVQRYEERSGHYFIDVTTDAGGFTCWVARITDTNFLNGLTNSMVQLHGVCATQMSDKRRINGFTLRLQDEHSIKVLGSATALECPISKVNKVFPMLKAFRFKVVGTVSWAQPTDLYVQDATGGIHVRLANFDTLLSPGDDVEVVGTRGLIDFTPVINNARVTPLKTKTVIKPKTGSSETLLNGEAEAEWVQLKAQLLEDVTTANELQFYAQGGGLVFQVCLQRPSDEKNALSLRQGSVVLLNGVSIATRVNTAQIGARRLLLHSPADIHVVWSAPRGISWQHVLIVTAGVVCLFLAGLGWVAALRRQVRLQTQQIHDRHEREATLQTQLRQAQKLESIGQLAAGIAHDFNNLLTIIQGHCDLIASDTHITPEAHESAEQIAEASNRAADLVRQLLAFSRKHPMRLELLDLNVALESITKEKAYN